VSTPTVYQQEQQPDIEFPGPVTPTGYNPTKAADDGVALPRWEDIPRGRLPWVK
jgi:hypothetical protein